MTSALPIIVLNLDRVPSRMEAVLSQFKRAELSESVERFSAVDASSPAFSAPGYSPGKWHDRWALLPSEQAIFASHRNIWQRIAEGSAAGAVICEDDILVSNKFEAAIRALDIERYGVIKLDGFSASRRYGPKIRMGEFEVRDILEAVPSAACYSISKAAACRLLKGSIAFCETLDDYVFTARTGIRPVQLVPAIAVQGMCCADGPSVPAAIAGSERDTSTTQARACKGPVLFRLNKELKRATRKLSHALGADRRLLRRGGVLCCPHLAEDLPKYKT